MKHLTAGQRPICPSLFQRWTNSQRPVPLPSLLAYITEVVIASYPEGSDVGEMGRCVDRFSSQLVVQASLHNPNLLPSPPCFPPSKSCLLSFLTSIGLTQSAIQLTRSSLPQGELIPRLLYQLPCLSVRQGRCAPTHSAADMQTKASMLEVVHAMSWCERQSLWYLASSAGIYLDDLNLPRSLSDYLRPYLVTDSKKFVRLKARHHVHAIKVELPTQPLSYGISKQPQHCKAGSPGPVKRGCLQHRLCGSLFVEKVWPQLRCVKFSCLCDSALPLIVLPKKPFFICDCGVTWWSMDPNGHDFGGLS